jgi:hypothetical protein
VKIYRSSYTIIAVLCILSLYFLPTEHSSDALAVEPSPSSTRLISEEEMPAILTLIANDIRDNYQRIITWSGEIDQQITWVHTGPLAEDIFKNATDAEGNTPEAILQKAEQKVTFAVDAKNNLVYVGTSQVKPRKYFNHKTGKDLGSSRTASHWSAVIARPDYLIEAGPIRFEKKTGRILKNKAVKRPSKQEPQTGWYAQKDIFDPRRAFFPGADFTWDALDSLIKRLDTYGKIEFDGCELKMEEQIKDDIVEYKIIQPGVVNLERSDPNHYVLLTKIFSSKCGFNMTYFEAAAGSGTVFQKFTWEYELIDRVYLPKTLVQVYYDTTGQVSSQKNYTYVNNKLNGQIPSGTFEYTNLGLGDGDVFIDEITDKQYLFRAATQTLEPLDNQTK